MRFLTLKESVILSICLHLMLVGLVLLRGYIRTPPPTTPTVTVELLPPPEPVVQMKPLKKIEIEKAKQVVEQDEKSVNDEKPDKADFLSTKDQVVNKQTVAREHGEFKNIKSSRIAQALRSLGEKTPEKKTSKSKPTLKDLALGADPIDSFERKQAAEKSSGGDQHVQAGAQVSQSSDYLKDVDEGLETMLNTREFKYYTYYTRIRRQLSQHWEPRVKEKLSRLFKQGRNIASTQDHITKLLITLNQEGNLVRVQVLGESGVTDLDDAAMEAFRSAAPFPNPPKGIVDPDGTVKIRWDFVLES